MGAGMGERIDRAGGRTAHHSAESTPGVGPDRVRWAMEEPLACCMFATSSDLHVADVQRPSGTYRILLKLSILGARHWPVQDAWYQICQST
jgi:hypothetical protein